MKVLLIAMLCLTGCVTKTVRHSIVVPPIVVNVQASGQKDTKLGDWLVGKMFGPDTAPGQIFAGCVSYFSALQRWPRSREELEEGFARTGRTEGLSRVASVAFLEEGDVLSVRFTTIDGFPGDMKLSLADGQRPNKAPEPTPTSVTSPAIAR